VAAGEACSNAVEHGHRSAPGGTIRLLAAVTAGALHLTVTDTGTWKAPQPQTRARHDRGRGITLMRGLVDQVTITPQPAGTTVDMYTRITR
jgi:anti-sigma regulatory factor (Ser/Thr protein kinase)